MDIKCEVSLGELVDKMTILKIKTQKISDTEKVEYAKNEFETLDKTLRSLNLEGIDEHFQELKKVNESAVLQ